MKVLLDTHILLWWASDSSRLSRAAFAACSDANNDLIVSVASVWEIQIKVQIGKLKLEADLSQMIAAQQQTNHLEILSVEYEHVMALTPLPMVHRDPFDRLLVAQANAIGATLVSADPIFHQYPVALLQ
jgi:PIN domain nuclease of toxin-antitoxin system